MMPGDRLTEQQTSRVHPARPWTLRAIGLAVALVALIPPIGVVLSGWWLIQSQGTLTPAAAQ